VVRVGVRVGVVVRFVVRVGVRVGVVVRFVVRVGVRVGVVVRFVVRVGVRVVVRVGVGVKFEVRVGVRVGVVIVVFPIAKHAPKLGVQIGILNFTNNPNPIHNGNSTDSFNLTSPPFLGAFLFEAWLSFLFGFVCGCGCGCSLGAVVVVGCRVQNIFQSKQ